jgi:hypothetical protein
MYTSSQMQTAELCKIRHQPTLASFSSHINTPAISLKNKKKILYRQIRIYSRKQFSAL